MSVQAWRDIAELDEWRPGWKVGIAHNIACTTYVPRRRKRMPLGLVAAAVVALVLVAWL